MRGHGRRNAYYIVGEGVFQEPAFLSGGHGCPVAAHAGDSTFPTFKFGRMFPMPPKRMTSKEWVELSEGLVHLGLCMNNPAKYCKQEASPAPPDSNIPAGYTYLGQFIAHEITFDNTQELLAVEPNPQNLRSPSLDLDSLYGEGPSDEQSRRLYEDGNPALLKLDWTIPLGSGRLFQNDLPRDKDNKFRALIGDPRNDENLAVAQTHVAFIKFHNKVVGTLKAQGHSAPDLFDCARIQVIRHFQWLILHDYLPTIVDNEVLECVRMHGPRWFRPGGPDDLYMPLEFSAAAFRIGHTMVRSEYQWNRFHAQGESGTKSATLSDLFDQTAFSGMIGKVSPKGLPGDWVIDWRRFYEFPEGSKNRIDKSRINMAGKLDAHFDMHLNEMKGFNHVNLPPEKQSITVRNLLRGFALGLPTGEEVAEWIGEEPLRPAQMATGPHAAMLSAPVFKGKTPLWYYILKEAELNGGSKLGPVGSRIVAETLVGLIKNSRYSILKCPGWYPRYTARGVPGTESATFGMVDLLEFTGPANVKPYGEP
jgi:hypothetical protein